MFTFSVAVFFLIATPGPGVLSAAGVGAAFGYKSGMAYVTGLFIGTNLVCFSCVSPELSFGFVGYYMAICFFLMFR